MHHSRVHLTGLGVLGLEVPPETALHETLDLLEFFMRFKFVNDGIVLELLGDWQGPFRHLTIAAIRNVNLANRIRFPVRVGKGGCLQPVLFGRQSIKELS